MASNQLLSSAKSSNSGLRAALHPLVLLTISDYITRHTLTHQTQPIVGALLGQQNGREITIEVAYDVRLAPSPSHEQNTEWQLDDEFFAVRLAQYKEVHKDPALDLVGWWTVSAASGPGAEVLGVHHHVLHTYNEAALLLAFCPESVKDEAGAQLQQQQLGGKLPLTIYETVYESNRRGDADADAMQVEGEPEPLELRFKELGYDIATGEAEMIGVDSVARGSGAATAGDGAGPKTAATAPASAPPPEEENPPEGKRKRGRPRKDKGKAKDEGEETVDTVDSQDLNAEEEELISFLGTRANAIRMLHSRISLLKSYLEHLPPSYLTDATTSNSPPAAQASDPVPVSHPLLRSIQALAARLPLLVPADTAADGDRADRGLFAHAQAAERSDVALVGLLAELGQSAQRARELGQRFGTVESQRRDRSKGQHGPATWEAGAEEVVNGSGMAGGWDGMLM